MTAITRTMSFDFEGAAITAIEYQGQPVMLAKELGAALGYAREGAVLTNKIRQWDEHLEGVDLHVLEGSDLEALRGVNTGAVSAMSRSAMVLTESGITLALAKSNKPAGRAFRRFLVDTVLPAFKAQQQAPKRKRRKRVDNRGPVTRFRTPRNLPAHVAPFPGQPGFGGYCYTMGDICEMLGLAYGFRGTLGRWMKAQGLHADPRFACMSWRDQEKPDGSTVRVPLYMWTPAALYAAQITCRRHKRAHAGYTPRQPRTKQLELVKGD